MEQRFFSFKEAAEFLRISKSLLERLVSQGEITSYKLGESSAGRRIFDQKDLVRWVKAHREKKSKPSPSRKRKGGSISREA